MLAFVLKKLNRLAGVVLNSKITYLVLIVIILVQFILTGIILSQNQRLAAALSDLEKQQKELNAGLNGLQSGFMQLQAQFYRLRTN